MKAKSKILVVHSSTGHVHALNEILKTPEILARVSDTKFAKEVAALDRFYKIIGEDETKAYYGPRHVEQVIDKGGNGTLLISDSLFR